MNGEKSHISGINKTIKFLKKSKNKKNQIIYCPPFTLISSVKNKVKNTKIKVGAQNLSQLNDYGAFTGSVNSKLIKSAGGEYVICLLYTSPSPRDRTRSRMPSSA